MNQKKIKDIIKNKLQDALGPQSLSIIDESSKHAGHAHAGQETHFRIKIVSQKFRGMSQVQRHRLVYSILAEELKTSVHALALTTKDED